MNLMMSKKKQKNGSKSTSKATRSHRSNSNALSRPRSQSNMSQSVHKKQTNNNSVSMQTMWFKKYEIMLKVGVDIPSVIIHMRKDNIQPHLIDQFKISHGYQPERITNNFECNPETLGLPTKAIIPQPQLQMKKIHWKPIELNKIKSSIWYSIDQQWIDYDTMLFESTFQQRKIKSNLNNNELKQCVATETKYNEQQIIGFVSAKRAAQISKVLKTFNMTNEELRYAILSFDETNLDVSKINSLIDIIPNVDEQLQTENMSVDSENIKYFGIVERFFYSLYDIIELKQRLKTWLFKLRFNDKLQELEKALSIIEKSKIVIMTSDNLKAILAILLAFGNQMNYNSKHKANAYGFQLNDLLLLPNIKTFDNSMTFPKYLYTFLQKRYPKLLDIIHEFAIVGKAANINTDVFDKEYDLLNHKMRHLHAMINRFKDEYFQTLNSNDLFMNFMTTFEESAKKKLWTLKGKYEAFKFSEQQLINYFAYDCEQNVSIRNVFKDLYGFIQILKRLDKKAKKAQQQSETTKYSRRHKTEPFSRQKFEQLASTNKIKHTSSFDDLNQINENEIQSNQFRRKRTVKTDMSDHYSRSEENLSYLRSSNSNSTASRLRIDITNSKSNTVNVKSRNYKLKFKKSKRGRSDSVPVTPTTQTLKKRNSVSLTTSASNLTPDAEKDHANVGYKNVGDKNVDDKKQMASSKEWQNVLLKSKFQNK